MLDVKSLIHKILQKGHIASLASVDDSGPWVSDVIYTFDENFNLYWISQVESRHSKAFVNNSKAACSITIAEKPEGKGVGIQMEGSVGILAQIPDEVLLHYSRKRNKKGIWTLGAGEIWFKLTANNIDVIHEPTLGFSKINFKPQKV